MLGQESRLASALESASLAGLVGDGTTGDLTGITTMSSSTTTDSYPTAEFSLTAATSQEVDSIVAAAFMGETFTARLIPAHSAALITVELREASPHEGSPASVEVSTAEKVSMEGEASTAAEVVTVVAEVTDNSVPVPNDRQEKRHESQGNYSMPSTTWCSSRKQTLQH